MSLVNDMLQDLEHRGAPGFDNGAATLTSLRAPDGYRPRRIALTLAVTLGLGGLAGGAWWWLVPHGESPGTTVSASPAHAAASPEAASREGEAPALRAEDSGSPSAEREAKPGETRAAEKPRAEPESTRRDAGSDDADSQGDGPRVVGLRTDDADGRAATLPPTADDDRLMVVDLTAGDNTEQTASATSGLATTPDSATSRSADPDGRSEPDDTRPDTRSAEASGEGGSRVEKRARPLAPEQRARVAYQEGRERMERGDRAGARARFRDALEHDPDHAAAHQALAAQLLRAGRVAEAAPLLAQGVRRHPSHPGLARLHARVLADRGRLDDALAAMRRAVSDAGDDAAFYGLLATLSQRTGAHEDAARAYRRALALRPGEARWWLGLGLALEAGGRDAQALEAFRRARQIGGLDDEVTDYMESRIHALSDAAGTGGRAVGMR